MEEKIIIALEIGSSKIKGATGAIDADGALNVKAVEEEPITDSVRYGVIRNVYETAQAVSNVINRLALREAPRKVEGVYVSIGGRSLASQAIEIDRRLASETIVTPEMIEDISREALNTPLPDRSIVGVTPRELFVDNEYSPRPVGVMGSHILARLNLLSCRTQMLRNLSVVIEEKLGLKIMDTFVRPLALADLVLLNEEKRLGCMLVDFGAETTTVAIFKNGVLQHLAVLPMGSRHITRDITALNYIEEQAEELKKNGGSAFPTLESTHAPGQPDFAAINNYVSARAVEIIVNICEQIKYAGLTPEKLPEGIVIVGKGARLNDFNRRLEQVSGMKVRSGMPGNRMRILDGRIQVADSVDVLSILAKAAKSAPQECLSPRPVEKPVPEPEEKSAAAETTVRPEATPTPQHFTKPTVQTAPKPEKAAAQPTVPEPQQAPKGPGIFKKFSDAVARRVAAAISETFEEEDDEE